MDQESRLQAHVARLQAMLAAEVEEKQRWREKALQLEALLQEALLHSRKEKAGEAQQEGENHVERP